MKIHNIALESFIPKGKILLKMVNGELSMSSKVILSKDKFADIPYKFKLPLRIDMTCKANSSDFKLLIGKGGIHFSAPINHTGGGIRRYDILTGKEEPSKSDNDADVPLNEYVNISVFYGSKITWVQINNYYCYFTRNTPYINLLENNNLPKEFLNGLNFAVSCGRNVELVIKSITITEYENDEPEIPAEIVNLPELSAFEWYIKSLPHKLRDEALITDEYLLKDLKRTMKFKKSSDKYGNITYLSPCGFQYKMLKYIVRTHDANPHDTSGFHEIRWLQRLENPDYTVLDSQKFSAKK